VWTWGALGWAGAALAQGWTVEPLFVGTDVVGTTGDVAAAIALTGAPADERLYFALVRETPAGNARASTLYLGILDCTGGIHCPAPTLIQLGDPQIGDGPLPSIAVEPVVGGMSRIHVVHSVLHTNCPNPRRRLEEHVYDPSDGTLSSYVVREPASCADTQLSHTLVAEDQVWSCWTEDPSTPGYDNQVWCGMRDLTDSAAQWTTELLADGVSTQDHAWFVMSDGIRYIVLRNRDTNPDTIAFHSVGTTGPLPDGSPVLEDDFPSIARASDGSLHAVWVEGRRRITYARCVAGLDCADFRNWVTQARPVRVLGGGGIDHPEIITSEAGRIFVLWAEDHQPGPGDQRRIHVKEKCLADPTFTAPNALGQVVNDIGNTPIDQTLLLGRPHAWVDEAAQILHIVYLEKDIPGANPSHGDALHAWRPIVPCP
jgi:hypothetical protein